MKYLGHYIVLMVKIGILLFSTASFGAIIRVPENYPTIQEAIDNASDGDIVLVQDGIYVESIEFSDYPEKPITSIIVQSQNGPSKTVIDGNHNSSVVAFFDTVSHNVLDGFTIRNGKDFGILCCGGTNSTIKNCIASNNGLYGIHGENYSATISNCTIEDNNGNGISCGFDSSPVISDCTIRNNEGTGIMCFDNSSPTISNCIISGNTAGEGGGVFCGTDSSPIITDCIITGNSAVGDDGGGISGTNNSSPAITNCIISDNTSVSDGGGIYFTYNCSPSITNCTITGNSSAGTGGGIDFAWDCSPTITNCTISRNSCMDRGGGLYWHSGSSPTLSNCTISNNNAPDGGGIYFHIDSAPSITNCIISDNTATTNGGIVCAGSTPVITNCTISNNSSSTDGGGIVGGWLSSMTIVNCIIWGNTAGGSIQEISTYPNSTTTITHSNIRQPQTGTGNISSDPMFVDPNNGDYHLQNISPCINSGTHDTTTYPYLPNNDIDGNKRPRAIHFDMGAYEYVFGLKEAMGIIQILTNITPFPFVLIDVNNDDKTSLEELNFLLQEISGQR